ncbi:MAG: helix-turn-helix transcriptional regulator [Oscillospiraceae bacterium]|nr:helix-turn-helix transcriptional regulator [Oscillospiraceae bacterium]
MDKKNTDDLQQELMESSNLNRFLSENQTQFSNESVAEILNDLFKKKNISKAQLAKQAGMSEIYLHQIFAGRRNPSRNRLLCLCYGLGASIDETQELLKLCGLAQLYPRLKRDAIIYYGLAHQVSLFEINDKLFAEDEETLL